MCGSSSTTRMVATASMLFGRLLLLRRRRLARRPLGPALPRIAGRRGLRPRLVRRVGGAVAAVSPAPRSTPPADAEHEEQEEDQEEEGQEPEEAEEVGPVVVGA